jgi:glycosyltransferase involved in cell wall biosynthesis
MKVLFHTPALNYRGTTIAVLDYARYNQEVLGNESVICYHVNWPLGNDGGNEPPMIERVSSLFELRPTTGDFNSVCHDIDVAYFLRSGEPDSLPDNTKTAVHAVFGHRTPHGNKYAYISEWLAEHRCKDLNLPYVPHIVDLPKPNADFREKLGIGKDKIVVGRMGGNSTFDLSWVHSAVSKVLQSDPRFVFVFLNTARFMDHPNIIYLDPIYDPQEKSNYIEMCDAFLHARSIGESFGLSVCEPLLFNKPTFSWNDGDDKHHMMLLKDTGLLYNNEQDLVEKMLNLDSFTGDYNSIVTKFNPTSVMNKFKDVFLS